MSEQTVVPMFRCPICETGRTECAGLLCWDCVDTTRSWTRREWRELERRPAEHEEGGER